MAERTTIDVVAIPGGWPKPWPNVAEIADHLPGDRWTLVRAMVKIEGGTQALRRTINARLQIATGQTTTISVPDAFGALILKIAAYQTDSRDRDRHLYDAAVLLCCIEDPYAQRERFAGSDRKRLTLLAKSLYRNILRGIPSDIRRDGQAALRLLAAP